jgi:hypothetical protein
MILSDSPACTHKNSIIQILMYRYTLPDKGTSTDRNLSTKVELNKRCALLRSTKKVKVHYKFSFFKIQQPFWYGNIIKIYFRYIVFFCYHHDWLLNTV